MRKPGTSILLIALLLTACVGDVKVVQGTVVAYDAAAKTLQVKDEIEPHATIDLSVEGAEIGAAPTPGDVVRIAFRESDGRHLATRVMNVTRQAELRQSDSGGH